MTKQPDETNPYAPPLTTQPQAADFKRWSITWTEIVVVLAILFLVAGMFASTRNYGDHETSTSTEQVEE